MPSTRRSQCRAKPQQYCINTKYYAILKPANLGREPMPTEQLTPLQQRVAREIIAYARRENLETGYHFTKLSLAQKIGISHNPVEAALAHLARIGVMTHTPDRGYFLARPAGELGKLAQQFYRAGDDPLYFKIVDYRLTHRLPNIVNEADLIRLFRTSRGAVRKALSR